VATSVDIWVVDMPHPEPADGCAPRGLDRGGTRAVYGGCQCSLRAAITLLNRLSEQDERRLAGRNATVHIADGLYVKRRWRCCCCCCYYYYYTRPAPLLPPLLRLLPLWTNSLTPPLPRYLLHSDLPPVATLAKAHFLGGAERTYCRDVDAAGPASLYLAMSSDERQVPEHQMFEHEQESIGPRRPIATTLSGLDAARSGFDVVEAKAWTFIAGINFVRGIATVGGALRLRGTARIENCALFDNGASRGGGVYFQDEGQLLWSMLVHNRAHYGGAVYSGEARLDLLHTIFRENVDIVKASGHAQLSEASVQSAARYTARATGSSAAAAEVEARAKEAGKARASRSGHIFEGPAVAGGGMEKPWLTELPPVIPDPPGKPAQGRGGGERPQVGAGAGSRRRRRDGV